MKKIAICVDMSASMDNTNNHLTRIIEEIYNNNKLEEIHLIRFDYNIQSTKLMLSNKDINLVFNGMGTDFISLFDKIDKEEYSDIYVITDGYSDFPKNITTPTTWVITTDVVPPFGKCVYINKIINKNVLISKILLVIIAIITGIIEVSLFILIYPFLNGNSFYSFIMILFVTVICFGLMSNIYHLIKPKMIKIK